MARGLTRIRESNCVWNCTTSENERRLNIFMRNLCNPNWAGGYIQDMRVEGSVIRSALSVTEDNCWKFMTMMMMLLYCCFCFSIISRITNYDDVKIWKWINYLRKFVCSPRNRCCRYRVKVVQNLKISDIFIKIIRLCLQRPRVSIKSS